MSYIVDTCFSGDSPSSPVSKVDRPRRSEPERWSQNRGGKLGGGAVVLLEEDALRVQAGPKKVCEKVDFFGQIK